MHIYGGHISGGIYLAEEYFEPEFCETCGDSDDYIGFARTKKEALELLTEIEYDGSTYIRYTKEHLNEALKKLEGDI